MALGFKVHSNKTFKLSILQSIITAMCYNGFSAGFEDGAQYRVRTLKGWANAVCTGNSRYHYCSDDDWGPSTHSLFTADKNLTAKQVVLKCTHADGSVAEKLLDYDGEKGQTKSTINLLITSATHDPLFKVGKNKIEYELKDDHGVVVGKGQSEALLVNVGDVECRNASVFINSNDCDNPIIVCREYFWQVRDSCSSKK